MFVTNIVNNAIESNNANNTEVRRKARDTLVASLLALALLLVINFVFGPWLWNNILRRLIPGAGTARWYDTVALAILLALVMPR